MLQVFHDSSTLAMTAIIWFVQLVHYPLFAKVGENVFVAYENEHTRRISWIVVPLMLVELGTAVGLAVTGLESTMSLFARWLGLLLLGAIWASTFFVQVPLHARLSRGHDSQTISRLAHTNWIRTVAWSLRACLVLLAF